jgi:hypothetical protein
MGIKMDKNRSNAYVGTFDCSSAADMQQLDEVRNIVKYMNRSLRNAGMDYQFYVKCQGRGKNRYERCKEYYRKKHGNSVPDWYIKSRVAMSLPISCADRIDAYIHRR